MFDAFLGRGAHDAGMNDIRANIVMAVHASATRFEESAKRMLAKRNADFADELVKQRQAALEFRANLEALKVANRMTKETLDILA